MIPGYGGIVMTHTLKSSSALLQLACQCLLLDSGAENLASFSGTLFLITKVKLD